MKTENIEEKEVKILETEQSEDIEVFVHLFLGDGGKGFRKYCLFILFRVNIASGDPCDGTVLGCVELFDLTEFRFDHIMPPTDICAFAALEYFIIILDFFHGCGV